MHDDSLYLRYLGVLGLLTECSPLVDEDTREQIISALDDACANHPLQMRRVLNRIEIESIPDDDESMA